MMKKKCSIILSIAVISMFLCSGSFAQSCNPEPMPVYLVNPADPDYKLDFYKEWCGDDLNEIKACSRSQEQLIYNTLPPYQQELYDQTKTKLQIEGDEGRLKNLISIKVYIADSPTVTFDDVGKFYKKQSDLYLEDVNNIATSRNITNIPDKLRLALAKIPPGYFDTPAEDIARLEAYINSIESGAADLKGLIGTSTDSVSDPATGVFNISILPIYVEQIYVNDTLCKYKVHNFETDNRQAWVIISYYSKAFVKPPLEE